jgi:hypothetical protein
MALRTSSLLLQQMAMTLTTALRQMGEGAASSGVEVWWVSQVAMTTTVLRHRCQQEVHPQGAMGQRGMVRAAAVEVMVRL